VITPSTSLADAMKCVLVSFDSTMRSNLSVGMPIDLACIERDSLKLGLRHRFEEDDAYFGELRNQWRDGVREVFSRLSPVPPASWRS
jgi:putative proteasome-type protease